MQQYSRSAVLSTAKRAEGMSIQFPGAKTEFTTDMNIALNPAVIPCFRVMDERGKIIKPKFKIRQSKEELVKLYKSMTQLNVMDQIFYDAQRQGRISFYMTHYGEEASLFGSASALDKDDVVFGQYREAGVLMWRGFTLKQFANQCFSTALDLGKGRQMPVHYGSRELNYHTISSPLCTQLPQAAGAAYAMKLQKRNNIAITYFGDGAASEGDFHAAMNFSTVLHSPMIFFCRNNGYAISTTTAEQYAGDGIAARGAGYGMRTVRVDGNDLLAVHEVTREARAIALKDKVPILIEAMTYRSGHHSTSDDSSRYRQSDEIQFWADNLNPLTRTRLLLEHEKCWSEKEETEWRAECRQAVLAEITKCEAEGKKPAINQVPPCMHSPAGFAHLSRSIDLGASCLASMLFFALVPSCMPSLFLCFFVCVLCVCVFLSP